MRRIYRKILLVVGMKIGEMLAAVIAISIALLITVGILSGAMWVIEIYDLKEVLRWILAIMVFGLIGTVLIYFIGCGIREWIKYNWNKAERIISDREKNAGL